MTAINFPDSPSNGDTHVVGGITYTYDSTETKWKTTINSNAFLPLSGGTVSGNLTLGSNQLTAGGLTYPTSDGTTGQYLQTDGAGALSFQTVSTSNVSTDTEQASTSGTFIDFSSNIPANVKRITILLDDVSTNGTSDLLIQIGDSGGIETTGYDSFSTYLFQTGSGKTSYTTGYGSDWGSTAGERKGAITLNNMSGNKWICTAVHTGKDGVNEGTIQMAGSKTLSGTLTQVRITTVNGTDTFDAGTINLMYEV